MAVDIPFLKSRLSDPREVARLLGLRIGGRCNGGVYVYCPIRRHNGPKLALRNNGGTLQARCFSCGFGSGGEGGDILTLMEAIEGDFRRGLDRAVELAGGAVGKPEQQYEENERCDPSVYHELSERVLAAGRLDGRAWVRPVEEYLRRRGLLELARADGWAALPGLKWLLDIAIGVCEEMGAVKAFQVEATAKAGDGGSIPKTASKALEQSEASAFSPPELLILSGLAQWGRDGKLRAKWGAHRLVVPWRGPDGRISALQRREPKDRPKGEDGSPKYVFPPWKPDWPYGSDRLCIWLDRKEIWNVENRTRRVGPHSKACAWFDASSVGVQRSSVGRSKEIFSAQTPFMAGPNGTASKPPNIQTIIIVEGAVDTLAARALGRGRVAVIGIPGIDGWRAEWRELVAGRELRYALDKGKDKPGIVPEDRACARIALDCAYAQWYWNHSRVPADGECSDVPSERMKPVAGAGSPEMSALGASVFLRDNVIEWLTKRERLGKALFCVLCGAPEPWLCVGCGRRRPKGKDWGEDLEARRNL